MYKIHTSILIHTIILNISQAATLPPMKTFCLLVAPHITLLHYNCLNLATLPPSVTDKVPQPCLMVMDHLLSPEDDLQETFG